MILGFFFLFYKIIVYLVRPDIFLVENHNNSNNNIMEYLKFFFSTISNYTNYTLLKAYKNYPYKNFLTHKEKKRDDFYNA